MLAPEGDQREPEVKLHPRRRKGGRFFYGKVIFNYGKVIFNSALDILAIQAYNRPREAAAILRIAVVPKNLI